MFWMFVYFLSFPFALANEEGGSSAAWTRRAVILSHVFCGLSHVQIPTLHQHPKFKTIFYKHFANVGSAFPNGGSPFRMMGLAKDFLILFGSFILISPEWWFVPPP